MRTFNVILAIDSTHGLSKDNKIPWNSEEDMKHFYDTTVGHIVIMDRTMHKIIGSISLSFCDYLKTTFLFLLFQPTGQTLPVPGPSPRSRQ